MVNHVIIENVTSMDTTLGSKEGEPLTTSLVDVKHKPGSGEHQWFLSTVMPGATVLKKARINTWQ